MLLRNYFDIFPQPVDEHIVASKENIAWHFINNKRSNRYRRLIDTEVKIYDTQG